jgi:hypothetical protein
VCESSGDGAGFDDDARIFAALFDPRTRPSSSMIPVTFVSYDKLPACRSQRTSRMNKTINKATKNGPNEKIIIQIASFLKLNV